MPASPTAFPFVLPAGSPQPRVPGWTVRREQRGEPEAGRVGLRAALRLAWRRMQSRRALARLDSALLRDIGVTFAEAEQEANKPFWVD